jgi:GNAT superfamily N-acetyltransferase
MSDLAGQLMVRGHESPVRQMAADGGDGTPFLNKPWEEAIAEFKARGVLKPTELSTLLKGYAQRADKARQLMLEQVQGFVRSELEKSLREGGTFKDFAARVEDGGAGLGITLDDSAYLDMVFRTNVQSAYGAGRYRAMTDPDVMGERPYSELRTVGDARVREEHAVLDGTVTLIGSPAFRLCSCPLGFNCRCANVTLTKDDVAGRQVITAVNDLPAGFKPTPGFIGPPTATINTPTKPLPPELKQKPLPVPDTRVAPSERVGATAESIFGRKLSDAELDALAGAQASLPNGYTTQVSVKELAPDEKPALGAKPRPVPVVQVEGEVKNADGKTAGSYLRQFTRDGDKTSVHHSFFFVDDDEQGKGLGRQLFNSQVDAYEKQGIDKVTLNATDVGRYVWSKAGFDWTDAAQAARVREQLAEMLTRRFGATIADNIMAAAKTPSDIARLVIDGEKVGKRFLIDFAEDVSMSQTPAKIRRL